MANGGDRTVAEFLKTGEQPKDLAELLTLARASLPPRVLAWLSSLKPSWRSGQVLFVHAGVNPQVELETFLAVPWNMPLDKLDEDRHWAWVRWPFLEHRPMDGFGGFFVVHGHTPNDARRDPSHADQIAAIPPQSRRGFGNDRGRQNGGASRQPGGGDQRRRIGEVEA